MALLSDADVETKLKNLDGWTRTGNTIRKQFVLKNFVEAVAFVDRLVEPAETANHHPDLTINYKRVGVSLATHDEGGITEKDFALAAEIEKKAHTGRPASGAVH